jgi:glycosyltransferase involved in cell wall biosynthesis
MERNEARGRDPLRVLMLGWEFPPYISGGLGTACYGLTKGLSELGTTICFLLPHAIPENYTSHVKLISSAQYAGQVESDQFLSDSMITIKRLNVPLYPYGDFDRPNVPVEAAGQITGPRHFSQKKMVPPSEKENLPAEPGVFENYGRDLETQIHHYCNVAGRVALREKFDVIHAHDWMTFPAAVSIAKISQKPLVVHVHSTEYDRSGENINPRISAYERLGMQHANRVITVSKLTGRICRDRYGIPEHKLQVVYNGVEHAWGDSNVPYRKRNPDEKIVLFLGRITMQKGPEYFVRAAKRVLEKTEEVKFIMAGSGDMFPRIVEMTAGLGIGHKVLFAGFLRGTEVDQVFSMADLLVMPSVSEPFGICPLEAMIRKVPVLISKQSGVAEILHHALQVDFWDIDEMANKILSVLRYPSLRQVLVQNGCEEAHQITWQEAARHCRRIYQSLVQKAG